MSKWSASRRSFVGRPERRSDMGTRAQQRMAAFRAAQSRIQAANAEARKRADSDHPTRPRERGRT